MQVGPMRYVHGHLLLRCAHMPLLLLQVSDHLQDFNGVRVLSPSHAPTACLPCHINMTHLMGKRKAPGEECKHCNKAHPPG